MFIIGPRPPSQLREIGVSIFPLSHNMTSKINPRCKKEWRLDATENQDWQNRGSGVEGRGGAVIVSGKMVWQQLIRLAELWLSNEQHPPSRHSHLTMLSTMNTHATRFSIDARHHNQIKEQIIRMEQKQKTERRELRGEAENSAGKFHSCVNIADHRILPTNTPASLHQKNGFPPSPQSPSGRLSVFLSRCLCSRRLPPRLQSDSELNIYSTQADAKRSEN